MYDIIAILIPIILAFCIVYVIRMLSDNRLRRDLAEMETEWEIVKLMLETDQTNRREATTRWGTLTLSLGLGMVAIHLFKLSAGDTLAYGILFVATGVGLVFSKFIRP